MSKKVLGLTVLHFSEQTDFYRGKVRDVYTINGEFLVMVVSDRISAFDVVLSQGIPFKGQVLNQIAERFLDATADIVPNWKIACPDPNVTIGHYCEPFKVEMVIRGYLTGHAWREYRDGKREICGVPMPEGMKEHDKFPEPILTPTTKAKVGHDEDISKEEIIKLGLVSKVDYEMLEDYTKKLFQRGTKIASKMNLILVDTKYEFGKKDGKIYLIDEIHTPDSSRYFISPGYHYRQKINEKQKQLSKEFVREWLIERNFQGEKGQIPPFMDHEFVDSVSKLYIKLYEEITGGTFVESKSSEEEMVQAVEKELEKQRTLN